MKRVRVKFCPHCRKDIYGPKGRPRIPAIVAESVRALRDKGLTITVISKRLKISVGSVHKLLESGE